jgi:hypothetical protein
MYAFVSFDILDLPNIYNNNNANIVTVVDTNIASRLKRTKVSIDTTEIALIIFQWIRNSIAAYRQNGTIKKRAAGNRLPWAIVPLML